MHPLASRLAERAGLAGLSVPDSLAARLLEYYDLLLRWNATINLTSITDPDHAIDRLLLEPVAAATHLARESTVIDLGSGGGSPALPLALALGSPRLVMVESKGRKAAFLREAARFLGLNAAVEAVRFEALATDSRYRDTFDVVTMRAVRMDEESLGAAGVLARPGGTIALFVATGTTPPLPERLSVSSRAPLLAESELLLLRRDVPRETSSL